MQGCMQALLCCHPESSSMEPGSAEMSRPYTGDLSAHAYTKIGQVLVTCTLCAAYIRSMPLPRWYFVKSTT